MCYSERVVGEKTSAELRLFVGSRRASAREYGAALRGPWGIENSLHWQLDVTFGEDRSRLRSGAAPQIMAALRNLALTLIRRTGTTQIAAYRQHLRSRPATALRFLVPKTRSA